MKIIIPMAGAGSRFRKIGINTPKHEILAYNKSLFEWSMLSLSDFFEYEFIFIIRKDMDSTSLKQICNKLSIKRAHFISIDSITDGQASTVMLASPFLLDDDSIGIYNIDTYVEVGALLSKSIDKEAWGFVPAFVAEGDKWSFVKTSPDKPNQVIQITEKIRISNLGTLGFYYFNKWRVFKDIYTLHKQDIIAVYKETYVAPMYQYLIAQNKRVDTCIIDGNKIHVLGTPEDLVIFCPNYVSENNLDT